MTRGGAGYGLIETMRVRRGRVPLVERHVARLRASLAALGLPAPPGDVAALVRTAAVGRDRVVRLEVRDGRADLRMRPLPSPAPPALVVAREPHAAYRHKTTERDLFERALVEARQAGADDALLLTADRCVAEGTVWSLFWWEGERLHTPALDLGILPGVGRARMAEVVDGMELVEVRLGVEALVGRSLFLVNAVRGVVPITSLAGNPVPVDPRTAELSRRFWPEAG